MTYYAPLCLACGGRIQAAQDRVTVPTGRGKNAVRYRHQSDADCATELRGIGTGGGGGYLVDEPDYTEHAGARDTLTSRHLRQGTGI